MFLQEKQSENDILNPQNKMLFHQDDFFFSVVKMLFPQDGLRLQDQMYPWNNPWNKMFPADIKCFLSRLHIEASR